MVTSQNTESPAQSEDASLIARQVRSGEFFRESLQNYHTQYHDPLSERYLFIGISGVSLLIFVLALSAMVMLYPLKSRVPFIYESVDIIEDFPVMKPLGGQGQDANMQIRQFLVTNYLRLREEYSAETINRNAGGVQTQSEQGVYADYEGLMDPSNPASPISQYQRHTVRRVEIQDIRESRAGNEYREEIDYIAVEVSAENVRKIPMRAIITFRFEEIQVNQETGETTPHDFQVTGYETMARNS